MKFNLEDLNPGTWFFFNEENPDDGKICLRVCNPDKLAEIRDKTITTEAEYKNSQRFEYSKVDHGKRDELIWDYSIVGWENLDDDDGNPIECTTENKLKLMNEHIGFGLFVESCLDKLNREFDEHRERLEKN